MTANREEDVVEDIAAQLKNVYSLCCMEKKELLLQTIVSPLVRLQLVHLILMDTQGGEKLCR